MIRKSYFIKILINITLVLSFISFFFQFLINLYIIPNDYHIPLLTLIGFGGLIFSYYYICFRFDLLQEKDNFISLKIFNGKIIKIILYILFIASIIFIPPISFSKTIIEWREISILNYTRAIISIITLIYLPGASIFNLLFPKNALFKEYNPFLIKITIFPLISLTFLASLTVIADVIGLLKDQITLFLNFSIFVLIFLDLYIESRRNCFESKLLFTKINISKTSFIVIILAFSAILIALGIHEASRFLIPGDSWRSISFANLIGEPNTSQFDKFYTTSIYWSYFVFSYSSLIGIPFINTHVLMIPLVYLFVTSIYLLSSAIMKKFHLSNSKSILATIFIITFSSFFYFYNSNLGANNVSTLIFDGIFNFRYKSLAFDLFLITIFLFLMNTNDENISKNRLNFKIIFLTSWFFTQSIMIYFIPFIPIIIFMSLYCIFSSNKKLAFRKYLSILGFFYLIFVFFDMIMTNFFSYVPITYLGYFFGFDSTPLRAELLFNGFLVYGLIGMLIMFWYIIYRILKNRFQIKMRKYYKNRLKIIFVITIGLIIILLEFEIFFNLILKKQNSFFLFYIHIWFNNIGIIGLVSIFLSYYFFKNHRTTFFLIITWLIITMLFASIIIFIRWMNYPFLAPNQIPYSEYFFMIYWFDRLWYYSIIPLSLIASFGIINVLNSLKRIKILNIIKKPMKSVILSILIILVLMNTIIAGMDWYNVTWYVKPDEAQAIGWVSKNIPRNSKILIDSHNFHRNTYEMSGSKTFWINEEVIEAINNDNSSIYGSVYREIDDNCHLTLIEELDNHYNVINFSDFNNNGYVGIEILPNFINSFGTIEFNIRTSNGNNSYWIDLDSIIPHSHGISIPIYNNSFSYYNGSEYKKIMDIENEKWYNYKLDFDCTNNSYLGLSQYFWKATINGTEFGEFPFWNNVSSIGYITLKTSFGLANWNTYIEGFKLSWVSGFNIINSTFKYLIFIEHLNLKTINYYIHKITEINYYKNVVEQYISIENELIQYYFSKKLYEYGDVAIYSISSL